MIGTILRFISAILSYLPNIYFGSNLITAVIIRKFKMNTSSSRLIFAFIIMLSAMFTPGLSHAFDEQLALKKFQTYAQENNIVFTFEAVEKPDDKTLIIKNADYYDDRSKQRQKIERMIFGDVRESAPGVLQYDSLELLNLTQKGKAQDNEVLITIERIISEGLKFSDSGNTVLLPSSVALAELRNMTVETKNAASEAKITFPSATATGIENTDLRNFISKSVELAPATGTVKSGKETFSVSLGAIKVEDMKQFGAQGFDVGLIDVGLFQMDFNSKTGEKIDFQFEGMTVENFFYPDIADENGKLYSEKDLKAEIKPLRATINGEEFMGWKSGYGTSKNDETTNTITSDGRIEGMYIDFGVLPKNSKNDEFLRNLEELNLVKMVLNIEGTGSWERDSGVLNINNYEFELEDGASFAMSARISGYTEEVARQFNKALNAINAEQDEKKKNALALQVLAQLAGLSFERMELVLDDNSLLDRVVNLQAKKLKQEPEQIKGIVGPMTTVLLTPYNIPELAAQMSQAFGTFMQGNKKLTIIAEPENGLAITEMIALGSGVSAGSVTPAELAKRINLTITAE